MYLAHPKKDKGGKWEVAWMWLPHFLTSDLDLHKYVDQKMTEAFRGQVAEKEELAPLLVRMHKKVIDLILEKYPIMGLRQLLEGYETLKPEEPA